MNLLGDVGSSADELWDDLQWFIVALEQFLTPSSRLYCDTKSYINEVVDFGNHSQIKDKHLTFTVR